MHQNAPWKLGWKDASAQLLDGRGALHARSVRDGKQSMEGPMQGHDVGVDADTDGKGGASDAGKELGVRLRDSSNKIGRGNGLLETGQAEAINATPKKYEQVKYQEMEGGWVLAA